MLKKIFLVVILLVGSFCIAVGYLTWIDPEGAEYGVWADIILTLFIFGVLLRFFFKKQEGDDPIISPENKIWWGKGL